jgi:hypothetical protein
MADRKTDCTPDGMTTCVESGGGLVPGGLRVAIRFGEFEQQPGGSFTEADGNIAMKFSRAGFGLP